MAGSWSLCLTWWLSNPVTLWHLLLPDCCWLPAVRCAHTGGVQVGCRRPPFSLGGGKVGEPGDVGSEECWSCRKQRVL